jgi:predicted NBD/HSP70 family sugar kinase
MAIIEPQSSPLPFPNRPSQTGLRQHNERLVLSLIRAHGSLPKAEVARLTGLSPQAASVIVRQLEQDGLVLKGKAQKGKVGQPLQPFLLNPEGAFSIGLKVGRRSGDMVLMGLDGAARDIIHQPYKFPAPEEFLAFAESGLKNLASRVPRGKRRRISGLGVAMPFDIWKWEEEAGAPHSVMEEWKVFNLQKELQDVCDWPVHLCNDATAACGAELLLGKGQSFGDFAYFYIGYFIGGGLVLNGQVFAGPTGNAAAFGSLPVLGPGGRPQQLIRAASLYRLERALRRSDIAADILWSPRSEWREISEHVTSWVAEAAPAIAQASVAIASVVDPKAIIIDGAMPAPVRSQLLNAVQKHLASINLDGIEPFATEEGTIGVQARALGAASLPLFANYMVNRDVFFAA